MANPKITYFKVYDTTNGWQIYYPRTTVAAIGVDSERKFLSAQVRVNGNTAGTTGAKVTVDSAGDGANIEIDGNHITWYSGTRPSTNYLGSAGSIQASLQALDTACKNAYDHVPTGCVTYGDGGAFGTLFPDLLAIEGLSGTSGLLKKTAANQWTLDQTVYVPDTRTVNGKRLNANISLGAGDIGYSNNMLPLATTVDLALTAIYNIAQGKQSSYAISDAATGTGVINTQLNSQSDVSINATFTVGSTGVTSDKKLKLSNNTIIDVATLKVGDNVYITETNVPDRWVSAITYPTGGGVGSITFSILETQKVDLSTYWNANYHPTTLANYGITDAKITKSGDSAVITLGNQTLDAYISNGTIYLNGKTIKPLTTHQSLASLVPYTGATKNVNLGTHSMSLAGLSATGTVSANIVSATTSVEIGDAEIAYDSNDNLNVNVLAGNFQISAVNMTLNSKNVATITAGTTQPSSPRVGDIWLDTTVPSA